MAGLYALSAASPDNDDLTSGQAASHLSAAIGCAAVAIRASP
jgi:hypothetical protein